MKTLNSILLMILLMLFQPSAHAGLLSSFLKLFERSAADLISGSKPVARSSARYIFKDGSVKEDRKDEFSRPVPLQPGQLTGGDLYQQQWLKRIQLTSPRQQGASVGDQKRPTVPTKTSSNTAAENASSMGTGPSP